jgi:hypothetical protein
LTAFALSLGAGLATAQSDDLGLNKGWGKVRTVDDICADDPKAIPCLMRDKNNALFQPLRTQVPARAAREVVSVQPVLEPDAAPAPAPRPAFGATRRFAFPVQLPAGNGRWRIFHNGTALAGGFNVKAWREAGMLVKLIDQLKAAGAAGGWESFLPLVEELDEAWILLDSASKQAEPVVLLSGRFKNPIWKSMLSNSQSLAGANAVLVGNRLAVAAARRRLALPGPLSKLALEAEAISKDNDIWMTGIPRLMPRSAREQAGAAGAITDTIQRFSLTVNVREKLAGNISLQTATPEAAEQLLAMYRLIETQAAAANAKEWEPIAKALTVESDASTLRVRFLVDPSELAPVVAKRMKAAPAGAGPMAPRKNIVIQGLEDGPREIPLDAPR